MNIAQPTADSDPDGSSCQHCVSCRQGTDTGVGFSGPPEWLMAGLELCGVPRLDAINLVCGQLDTEPGMVPDRDSDLAVLLCVRCHSAGPLPGAGMALGVLPRLPYYSPARRPQR